MTGRDVALLARTAVHLRPGQIAQRARLRTQRAALRRFPPAARWLLAGPDPATAVGWPAGFSPLDARLWRDRPGLPDLREGRLELLGMGRTLIRPAHRGPAAAGWAVSRTPGQRRTQHGPPGCRRIGSRRTRPRYGGSTCITGTGLGAGRRAGPGRRPGLVRRALAILAGGDGGRPGGCVAPLPGGPARLVVLRSSPGPDSRQRDRGLLRRQPVHPRRVPAPAPGNRCRRQPSDQEPQGAGRAGGVLRRRGPAGPGAGPADRAAGRADPARRRPLRAGPRLPLSRCSPT